MIWSMTARWDNTHSSSMWSSPRLNFLFSSCIIESVLILTYNIFMFFHFLLRFFFRSCTVHYYNHDIFQSVILSSTSSRILWLLFFTLFLFVFLFLHDVNWRCSAPSGRTCLLHVQPYCRVQPLCEASACRVGLTQNLTQKLSFKVMSCFILSYLILSYLVSSYY